MSSSSVVVCNTAGRRARGPAGGRATLHGGPGVLRPVRATLCYNIAYMKCRDQSVSISVYLFICLLVCFVACPLTHVSKPRVQISPNFLHTLPVAVARSSSDGSAICYVLPLLWMIS